MAAILADDTFKWIFLMKMVELHLNLTEFFSQEFIGQ